MTLELVKCPHCGNQYRTNVKEIVDDGETDIVRLGFSDVKKLFRRKTAKSLLYRPQLPQL